MWWVVLGQHRKKPQYRMSTDIHCLALNAMLCKAQISTIQRPRRVFLGYLSLGVLQFQGPAPLLQEHSTRHQVAQCCRCFGDLEAAQDQCYVQKNSSR